MDAMFHEAKLEMRELLRKRESRTPWPPVAQFAWVYYCCYSGLRYYHPYTAATLGIALPAAICAAMTLLARQRLRDAAPARVAVVLAAVLWVALALGALAGEVNFREYTMSFFRVQDLAAYTNIDPSLDKGQSYMDAGQVYFREGSRVAAEQVSVFRSDGVYCAAPILNNEFVNQDGEDQVEQDGPLKITKAQTVDFWAVGTGCCDEETKTFTCGAVPHPGARAGVRFMRDDIRPFFALAVQQWTARMCPLDDNTGEGRAKAAPLVCPMARHPLFFHWVEDPLEEVDNVFLDGRHLYSKQVLAFFFGNALLAALLHFALFELGLK